MGLVDDPEVALEAGDDARVRVEQRLVSVEEVFEHRLPPGELEFVAERIRFDVALGEVLEERREAEVLEAFDDCEALDEVVQHLAVGREFRDPSRQLGQWQLAERDGACVDKWLVEEAQLLGDLAVELTDVRDSRRHGRRGPVRDVAVPQDALTLSELERLVQVLHNDTGPHVVLRELAQLPAAGRRQIASLPLRVRGMDDVRQRVVEDRGAEAIERLAQVEQQAEVDAELAVRLCGAHPGATDELLRAVDDLHERTGVELDRRFLRAVGLIRRLERNPVPGRVVGAVLELTELAGCAELAGDGVTARRDGLDGVAVKTSGCDGRLVAQFEAGELLEGVKRRDAERGVGMHKRVPVVGEHVAESDERVVQLVHRRLAGLLVARDRGDGVTAEGAGRDGEPLEPNALEPSTDGADARRAGRDDKHTLAVGDEQSERVDNGLREAGTRHRVDDGRVARRDRVDDALLLGVRVE
ncbi:hypothetical protein ACFPRL_27600 [Pseudoclavibacter helvolus]